jgi:hypothetical protein
VSTTEGTDRIDTAGTASLPFVEELFEQWLHDPASVPADWRAYFDALGGAAGNGRAGVVPVSGGRAANGHGSSNDASGTLASGNGAADHGAAGHGAVAGRPAANGDAGHARAAAEEWIDEKLVAPDGIPTGHAVALANGAVRLPDAPAGEAMPLPLPPLARARRPRNEVEKSGIPTSYLFVYFSGNFPYFKVFKLSNSSHDIFICTIKNVQ